MTEKYIMGNWWREVQHLKSWNVEAFDDVPVDVINFLKNEDIKKTNNLINQTLAGQIKEEYKYTKWPQIVEDYLINKVETSPILQKYTESVNVLSQNRPFYLNTLWCNFQKKYEFNPIHNHQGMFSFIIFLQIPYNLSDEDNYFPETSSKKPSTSRLCFLHLDNLGHLVSMDIDVDKSFENKIIMFPAVLQHQVYPFYTSDDYRITVSGNIKLIV